MTPPHLEAGRIIGQRYTIRRLVSRGVLSALYEAISAPNREILLEVFAPLDPSRASSGIEEKLARVVDEVNALPASLALPVLEAGIDQETRCPFIASIASVTPPLSDLVKLCPLTGEELVAFIARLCSALDAAHARSLIHASLDATKIFVGPAPRFDVRLAGLGAFLVTGRAGEREWAAPEAHGTPSIASDVYSAALCALYAATGSLPEDAAAFVKQLATHAENDAGPPSPIDARLAEPLARALASSPEGRPASAGELARAVTAAMGSSFAVSGRWAAAPQTPRAVPAPSMEEEIDEVEEIHPPPAVTSVDALTAPIAASGSDRPHVESPKRFSLMSAKGSRAKVMGAIAASALLFAIGGVVIAFVLVGGARNDAPVASPPPPMMQPSSNFATVPEPPPSASDVPAAASEPPPPPPRPSNEAGLVVTCVPECASITVDGKTLEEFPATLKPGGHNIVARRGVHPPQYRYVQLAGGRDTKITFVWRAQKGPKK